MRRTARAILAATTAVALTAAACTGGGAGGDDPLTAPGPGPTATARPGEVELGEVELASALRRYDSCHAYLADVQAEALDRVTAWGLDGHGHWPWPVPAGEALDDAAAGEGSETGGPSPATPDGSGREVSGTNVQEVGVDEPDLVKTDGRHLYAVSGGELHVVDLADPGSPTLVSSTPLAAGWGAELLLHGDRLLVTQTLSGSWDDPRPLDTGDAIGSASIVPGPDDRWAGERMSLTLVDVADPAAPRVERTWSAEGAVVSARMVDGVARVVVRSHPTRRLPFVQPAGPNSEEAALATNRAVIEASAIEQWVPSFTLVDDDGTVLNDQLVARCDRLYRPAEFSGFGVVSVVTVDLDAGLGDGSGVALGADGETVYATADRLYVATNRWVAPSAPSTGEGDDVTVAPTPVERDQRTAIHQFSIEGSGAADHLASGSVEGHLLDQFSMSEHQGVLRVATTDGTPWGGATSESAVAVLALEGDRLVEIGRVDGLGEGERIYAVRFLGDRGFVVTFRQIDPLYAIDLSDPSAPRLTGELKIPGFSSYLHPVDDDLLLGVGQDATEDGRVVGGQVSLFDVSDPTDPARVAQLDLGADAGSEVEMDHRAFLWWDGLALVPITAWRWDDDAFEEDLRTGAVGIDVDVAGRALAERGRVSHLDRPDGIGDPGGAGGDPWGTEIRRSVVVDDVLLTLSERGVLASELATLQPVGWLAL